MTTESCAKLQFNSKKEAWKAIGEFNENNKGTNKKRIKRAYPCPLCKKWHLTSKL